MTSRAYLDHAATAPMLAAARDRWLEVTADVGNPSSLHASGRRARRIVEEARESIAADLDARPSAVLFTGGGTEADNLAVKGMVWQRPNEALAVSSIEHHAVLDPAHWLAEAQGTRLIELPVQRDGLLDMAALELALSDGVGVCSVMWANNEVGTVQPVQQIAATCRSAGAWYHVDAVQALGQVPVSFAGSGAHALTISGHKVGGPFGIGALLVDPLVPLTPLVHGGGQERRVRSGTLDAPGAAAFAVAVHSSVSDQAAHAQAVRALRNALVERVLREIPSARLNGSAELDGDGRLPGNAHFTFPGCEGDALLMLLDAAGIDCSTGSACTAGIPEPSHVLLAMGADSASARESLRFSLGRTTTNDDLDRLMSALPGAVDRARRAGSPA